MKGYLASRIVDVFGPVAVLHAGAKDDDLLNELLLRGCDAWAVGDRPIDHPRWLSVDSPLPPTQVVCLDLDAALAPALSLDRLLVENHAARGLALHAPGRERQEIEARLFGQGWRRHPADGRFGDHRGMIYGDLAFYQPVPSAAVPLLTQLPQQMDALRSNDFAAGSRIARYMLVADLIRPGDTVLDGCSGMGEGVAVLAGLSRGSRFIGMTAGGQQTAYAQASYGSDCVAFWHATVNALTAAGEGAFGIVVAFDADASAEDMALRLDDFRRLLRPDGRLIVGLRAPRVAWDRFTDLVGQTFILESHHIQRVAETHVQRVEAKALVEAEWSILVASANPLAEGETRRDAFHHPAFDATLGACPSAVVDFRASYDNPYLYRAMVQMGERLSEEGPLSRLALWVTNHARPQSADRGAALCVLGYRALESRDLAAAAEILDLIRDYRRVTADIRDNLHVTRWRLSLAFIAGRLSELSGDRVAAMAHYREVDGSWDRFSPLLATKTVSAAFLEGRIHLSNGDADAARGSFLRGLRESLRAVGSKATDFIGDYAAPIPFGMQELAEVVDMGSQCANAIAHLEIFARDPGLFWRQVEIRRFGLASWARDLERENATLRHEIAAARLEAGQGG